MNIPVVQARGCTNFRLRQLSRLVTRFYDGEFARVELKGTQFSALACIAQAQPVRPGDLSRMMGMDASTLTRNLRVLIDHGWVELGPGPDARSRMISLTDAGQRKLAEARVCWKRAQRGLNTLLGAEEIAALHALLDHGLAALTAHVGHDDGGEPVREADA
ncbi:MAG: MarR family winged helix-turn-helix transcriptional regulator [Burkholderiaceae bacterium]